MKKAVLLVFFVQLAFCLFAQMSDEQVVKLLGNAQKQGMNQQEMMQMLAQKGVTQEQLMRIKREHEQQGGAISSETTKSSRMRTGDNTEQKSLPKSNRDIKDMKIPEETMFVFDSLGNELLINEQVKKVLKEKEKQIFGRDIFNNNLLTFEPNLNVATPVTYILGAGDEVIIDIWGDAEKTIREEISPDGNIVVDEIGPIYLNGITVKEANSRLKNVFGRIYSTMIGSYPTTFLNLSLGQIRSIKVNVMGEVKAPGTYTLPSLASLFHALYSAGGVNEIGSLREVKVSRNGREIAKIDIYQYLLNGKNDQDISLKDGDVIVVPPYQNLIALTGKVKRPMIYELKEAQTVKDLLDYAGSFTGDAYKKAVRVIRKSGREHQVYNVEEGSFGQFSLTDGDAVSVDSVINRFENRVEVQGAVYRKGLYDLESAATVKKLVEKSEGLRGDAFMNRAVLYREKPDLTIEVEAVDLAGILNGKVADISLRNNDVLYIPSMMDLREEYTINISGAIGYPGTYKYASGMTLEDLIIQSGGLKESASMVNVEVARRIKDPKSTSVDEALAQNFTLTIKDGLLTDGKKDFTLQPFDEVYVRTSPGYRVQQNVFLQGEILFEGTYVLDKKGQRLSDLIRKAGGLTSEAYIRGARLTRRMTNDEKIRVESMLKLSKQGSRDSIDIGRLDIGDTYFVGIDLSKAMEKPGSDYDIVLRSGDRLQIPQYSSTVKISGGVMYPNTVTYKKGVNLKYYIDQGGGFAYRAKKSRVFVVYMNGTVSKAKGLAKAKVEPGCEIIVPVKPNRKGLGLAEILGITNSTISTAAMVTSLLNVIK